MHKIILLLALLRIFLLHRVRDRQTRIGLFLLPVIAFVGIGAYKILVFGDTDILPDLTATSAAVVLVDPGGRFPGLDIDAAEAVRRISTYPGFAVTLAAADPGDAPLQDRTADIVVAVRDGRVQVASGTHLLPEADLLRDLLMRDARAEAPVSPRFDVRIVPAEVVAGSGLINLLPFYFLLMLNAACGSTGTAAFVADQRKGTLRHFLLVPVGQGALLSTNAVAITALAIVQAFILLAVLALYGEVPRVDLPVFATVLTAGALLLTSVGFAAQSFRPAETPTGGGAVTMIIMVLAIVAMQVMMLSEPSDDITWVLLANPMGALMDLIRQALTGGGGFNPAWMSFAALAAWTILAAGIATARFAWSLEPDWSRR